MAEQETEIQAIERLEAALARIAAHAARPAPPGGGDGRAEVAAALDRMIEQLRAALDEADRVEQG